MKTKQTLRTVGVAAPRPGPRRAGPLPSRIGATCLALALAVAPFPALRADDGFMVMQFEFALGARPSFQRLNMTYQAGATRSPWAYYGDIGRPGVLVPLYSMNPREPGLFNQLLFNRLDGAAAEQEQKEKGGIRAVVSAVLGAGMLAAYAYATGKCIEDIGNWEQESAACDAVASGW